jgi:hypothetical protein
MLFCWQREALSILPALPARLDHGLIRGLVFPEGTLDIRWESDGRVEVTVYAKKRVDTAILLGGAPCGRVALDAGCEKTLMLHL